MFPEINQHETNSHLSAFIDAAFTKKNLIVTLASLVALVALLLIGTAAGLYLSNILGIVPAATLGASGVALGVLDFSVLVSYFTKNLIQKLSSRESPIILGEPDDIEEPD